LKKNDIGEKNERLMSDERDVLWWTGCYID